MACATEQTRSTKLYRFDKRKLCERQGLVVVGDIHGNFDPLLTTLAKFSPETHAYVFLGDYVDRGGQSVEVVDVIHRLMRTYPHVIALKGNHEVYTDDGTPDVPFADFVAEVERKRGSWARYFSQDFKPFLDKLYLAAIIPEETLFVHGGISSRIRSAHDLAEGTKDVEELVMWSDPVAAKGERRNRRGSGVEFGPDVTEKVCKSLGVKRIIRGHEPVKSSIEPCYEHDGRVITASLNGLFPYVIHYHTADLATDLARPSVYYVAKADCPKPNLPRK